MGLRSPTKPPALPISGGDLALGLGRNRARTQCPPQSGQRSDEVLAQDRGGPTALSALPSASTERPEQAPGRDRSAYTRLLHPGSLQRRTGRASWSLLECYAA